MTNNNTVCNIYNAWDCVLVHILFAEGVVIFLLNFVCLCFIFNDRKLLKNLPNIYLAGLLFSHGGSGLAVILSYTTRRSFPTVAFVSSFVRFAFYTSACCYTFLLSMDRYLAIKKPFFYQTISKRFILITNITVILIAPTTAFFFAYDRYTIYFAVFLLVFVSLMLAVFNCVLYFELRKQFQSIRSTSVHKSTEQRKASAKDIKQRQLRALKICVFITVSYIVFWYPFTFSAIFSTTSPQDAKKVLLTNCLEVFGILDSVVDPLICIHLNKSVKRKIRSFFKLIVTCKNLEE